MPPRTRVLNSSRFDELKKNINEIEKHLVPKKNPLGNSSLKDQLQIRSYKLLVHAEFESYFENVLESKIKFSVKQWKKRKNQPSSVLMNLLGYTQVNNGEIPIQINDPKRIFIEARINAAVTWYIALIIANNGIKQKDLLKLLLPIGLNEDEIDNTFLTDMDLFGEQRGESAHESMMKVKTQYDPQVEKKKIHQLLGIINKIDKKIVKLM